MKAQSFASRVTNCDTKVFNNQQDTLVAEYLCITDSTMRLCTPQYLWMWLLSFTYFKGYSYKSYSVNSRHLTPETISTKALCYMFQSLHKFFRFCVSHIWLNTTRPGQTTPQPSCQNCVGEKRTHVLWHPTDAENPDGRGWSWVLAGCTA